MLQKIAKCMTEGALKGRSVSLTGRADQRGETEYNMALGERRASAAQRYLSSLGVKSDRLQSTSRGELDATGTDESSMQEDRRCDIDLVK
jgi:peptidoglycan-associated lipoprotein